MRRADAVVIGLMDTSGSMGGTIVAPGAVLTEQWRVTDEMLLLDLPETTMSASSGGDPSAFEREATMVAAYVAPPEPGADGTFAPAAFGPTAPGAMSYTYEVLDGQGQVTGALYRELVDTNGAVEWRDHWMFFAGYQAPEGLHAVTVRRVGTTWSSRDAFLGAMDTLRAGQAGWIYTELAFEWVKAPRDTASGLPS